MALEQRLMYRLQEYLADRRGIDAEFTLPGLRGWMVSQPWPELPVPQRLECLSVLVWSAICQVDDAPEREGEVRHELMLQLEFLEGGHIEQPPTLAQVLSETARTAIYQDLRAAANPGSMRRATWGLPRFNAADKRA
ncbi:MAG TPA: hypothetical protein VFP05_18150 [Thermomicrobiales bacterium]|nr:hypothetical protein [Thermomicrobiales bacterium]